MSQQGTGHRKSAGSAPRPSLFDLIKVVLRLGPKQVKDELQLAIGQLKAKGIAAGIAIGLMVVGLVFLSFLVVALIIAAVAAVALFVELWAAALIVAGFFLLVALIFALIGFKRLKKALPLKPEDAIRGLRLDLGVAKEGRSFDPKSLDRRDSEKRRRKQEEKRRKAEEAKKPGGGKPPAPSYRDLLRRTALRREHLGEVRDSVASRVASKMPFKKTKKPAPAPAEEYEAAQTKPGPAAPGVAPEDVKQQSQPKGGASDFVSSRWKPLTVLGASAAAGAVFVRELIRGK